LLVVGRLRGFGHHDQHRLGVHDRRGVVTLIVATPATFMIRDSSSVRLI
jgi:hypothetical protein